MQRMFREPLLWFLLAGAVLFWLDSIRGGGKALIAVTPAIVSRLDDQWQAQMGRPATATEMNGLIADWVQEEIYAREALAMGLDADDTIIRRRLVQKLRFLTEDLAVAGDPSDAELKTFYAEHAADYREPDRFDFEHRFFSADRRQDAAGDARKALEKLHNGGEAEEPIGDPFLLQKSFFGRSERQIGDLFGRSFAARLAEARPPAKSDDEWFGPVTSAYGEHLVRIDRKLPSFQPPLNDVRQRVIADFNRARREAANLAFYEQLKAGYEILQPEARES